MEVESYSSRKIAFHAGSTGSSLGSLHAVTLVGLVSHLLWTSLPLRVCEIYPLSIEFGVYVLPLLLATTLCSDHVWLLLAAMGLAVMLAQRANDFPPSRQPSIASAQSPHHTSGTPETKMQRRVDTAPPLRNSAVTVYRAQMMLITIICILAVDFPIFPRAFGKCEVYGTSLMDLGVGSFVFSAGLVSAASVSRNGESATLLQRAMREGRRSIGVVGLGLMRVLAVKGLQYPERVTEYGAHWNFFFTLGLMPWIGLVCQPLRRKVPLWLQAVAITAVHQSSLHHSLAQWALFAPRTSLMSANKEGLVSLPGYAAIFVLGLEAGYRLWRQPEKPQRTSALLGLTVGSLLAFTAGYTKLSWRVSRQLANLPYVLWICAFNCVYLLIAMLLQQRALLRAAPRLMAAFNANGLMLFLLANALTGFVNMSVATIDASDGVATFILLLYSALVSFAAWRSADHKLRF